MADAAKANPSAERDLLMKAKTSNQRELREEAQRVKAAADRDAEATHARIHRERRLSTFTDGEGALNLRGSGHGARRFDHQLGARAAHRRDLPGARQGRHHRVPRCLPVRCAAADGRAVPRAPPRRPGRRDRRHASSGGTAAPCAAAAGPRGAVAWLRRRARSCARSPASVRSRWRSPGPARRRGAEADHHQGRRRRSTSPRLTRRPTQAMHYACCGHRPPAPWRAARARSSSTTTAPGRSGRTPTAPGSATSTGCAAATTTSTPTRAGRSSPARASGRW